MARPPMGWNSWDCFGPCVTEDEVRANAAVMAERLLPHGWDTVVIDIQWYEPTAHAHGYNDDAPLVLNEYGIHQPAPNRFPSAADGTGFRPLFDHLHALGLRAGLHVMRGIPKLAVARGLPIRGTAWTARDAADTSSTCAWNHDNVGLDHDHPAAQAYYDSQVATFAAWGVDFLKVDDMAAPYYSREVAAYAEAIRRSGRDIALSLSPGTRLTPEHLDHLRAHARMWRISDDLWDRWVDVRDQFDRLALWAPLQREGGWADADMLPLGRIGIRAERGEPRNSRLTPDEQRTLMSLWLLARSPLMMGGDLPSSAEPTFALLTNDDALAVLDAHTSAEVHRDASLRVWRAEADAATYVGVFCLADEPVALDASHWTGPRATDLWDHAPTDPTHLAIPAHGARLLRIEE
ncbi:MAG: glycoside hydrolase family 27 protein [Demequina sp.]|uniref:glycoside hydrolase family 27 protein n=1 Tax=Demequina sp. TaxID=2050685 RepID=UPI003A89009A